MKTSERWDNPDRDITQAADELVDLLSQVRPPLKGTLPQKTTQSPYIVLRVLDTMIKGLEDAGIETVSVAQLKEAIDKVRGTV